MSEERNIEKQLRAYADQRRKDAGGRMEMHPATRRLLHGERQRVRGKEATPAPAPKSGLFSGFWPRLAWGVSMFTVLAVGTWVFVRSQPPATPPASLASTETADRESHLAKTGPAPAPMESRADSSVSTAAAAMPALTPAPAAPAAAPPPAVAPSARPMIAAKATAPAKPANAETKATGSIAKKADYAQSVDALSESVAGGKLPGSKQVAQNVQMRFNNSLPPQGDLADAFKSRPATAGVAPAAPMLETFQLEQNGSQVRIVDQDGSVYEGVLLADAREEKRAMPKVTANAPAPDSLRREADKELPEEKDAGQMAQNFRFAVAGTNLSLRQRVSINGEFVAATNAAPNQMDTFSNQQLRSRTQNGLWISNGRVIGRAITTDGQQIELNATEVLK